MQDDKDAVVSLNGNFVVGPFGSSVSLAELLARRRHGLTEPETWALLCQAVQALQDLFLSDSAFVGQCLPLVTPNSLLVTSRGRVLLPTSRHVTMTSSQAAYLAPEYRHGKKFSDTESEKMWIFSLGETLTRTALTSQGAVTRLTPGLCRALTAMTRREASHRANLMCLLNVISEYCKSRVQTKPFSHIIMELYQEVHSLGTHFPAPGHPSNIPRQWSNINQLSRSKSSGEIPAMHLLSPGLSKTPAYLFKSQALLNRSNPQFRPLEPQDCFTFRNQASVSDSEQILNRKQNRFDKAHAHNGRHRTKLRNPVQRAASRLYKAEENLVSEPRTKVSIQKTCIGPEFVVRASLPCKQIKVGECKSNLRKVVTVILLNGQKIDVLCDPNTTTAGQIFEAIIQMENMQENFMLGLSVLMTGDFIFLPSDTRVCKVSLSSSSWSSLVLFLRVRLFLPSLRGLRDHQARHGLYLQLRRGILEQQLPCVIKNLITLGGLALQAEFGDFREKEHGATDYFLLEHYVPEAMLNENSANALRQFLTTAHKERNGLDRNLAEQQFIQHAQALPHYGGHFYAAVWVTKEKQTNVWLCVTAKGISLYVRVSGPPAPHVPSCQVFEWRSIQTLCYSKQFLCILPHSSAKNSKPTKCKLKMDHKKSYFTFRLASLHHQFFLRLRTEYSSLHSLAQEFGIPLKDMKNESNTLCKMNPISTAQDTQFKISYNTSSVSSRGSSDINGSARRKCKRSKSATEIRLLNNNTQLEEYQNKENENPQKHFASLTRDNKKSLVVDSSFLSGVPNVPSLNRRHQGVRMGTRAIIGTTSSSGFSSAQQEQEFESFNSSAHRFSSDDQQATPQAYVLNSSIKSCEKFLPDFQETISDSLAEKFDKLSFTEERLLRSVTIIRNERGSLGLQITEGSDGNVYVQSVIPDGPADQLKVINQGDQIVAVDGKSLVNLNYSDALNLLKQTGQRVEFVLSQICLNSGRKSIASRKNPELFKSCLDLNRTNGTGSGSTLYNSCFDISHIETENKSRGETSFFSSPLFNYKTRRNLDISAINLVENSRMFEAGNSSNLHGSITPHLLNKNRNFEMTKTPVIKSKSWNETSNPSRENTYRKHIRYEAASEIEGVYSNTLTRLRKSPKSYSASRSCEILTNPRMYSKEFEIDSCSGGYGGYLTPKKLTQDSEDTFEDELRKIALPRSLGLGRKWKGPVRYPVTPARPVMHRNSIDGTSEEEGTTTYTTTSDEEQIFI